MIFIVNFFFFQAEDGIRDGHVTGVQTCALLLAGDGEILVRGENVAAGYWKGGALEPSVEAGWLHTGDLGELDAQGNLRFRGRKKNVIVTAAGLNVYPEDIEGRLRELPEIRDCAVVPWRHGSDTEPCAVLVLQSAIENPAAAVGRANHQL